MVTQLTQPGWLPDSDNPAPAVRTALERLVAAGEVTKGRDDTGTVTFRYTRPEGMKLGGTTGRDDAAGKQWREPEPME